MKDTIYLGSSPTYENCVQVGEENYDSKAMDECKRYRELIRTKVGSEPEGARLLIKSFPHDFGSYYEVICEFDGDNMVAAQYAYNIEENGPLYWSENEEKWY